MEARTMVRSAGTANEPLAAVVIGGVLHHVPASQVEIETEIEKGVQLEAEIKELQQRRSSIGESKETLIAAYHAEINKLEEELRLERGPVDSQIATKQAELERVKGRLYELMEPRMGEQKSMKFTGLAGSIEVVRTPKIEVPSENIGALRKLLGDAFTTAFEVTEKAKALSPAFTLLKTLKGSRLAKFQQLVKATTSGRVRFLS